MEATMDARQFERDRLELFRQAGFAGRSIWLDDPRLGVRTYAIARGESSCPTVLVHGGIAEASVWYALAPLLRGAVVIVDRPGHGLTSAIDYDGVDYRAHAAAWLAGVVDALGVSQVNLVGNSMGGYFSTAFALSHPTRVRRLMLAGAPAGIDRRLPFFLRAWGRPGLGRLVSAMMRSTRTPEQMRARVMAGLCSRPEAIPVEALRIALAAGTRPDWHATMRSMLRAVSDLGGWRRELSLREAMTTLAVPTLFAWGTRDSFAPPSSGHELAARMPEARVDEIDGAGHLPQLDDPAAVAASIQRFLDAPAARSAIAGDTARVAAA
jgi:pimeloyl-ACP methyl ester carboxylesterase